MLYMVIEHFTAGAPPVYERYHKKGRMLPDGLEYVDSWVSEDLSQCFQVMSCDDRSLLDAWMSEWSDIVTFEVVPVISSDAAKSTVAVSSGPGT